MTGRPILVTDSGRAVPLMGSRSKLHGHAWGDEFRCELAQQVAGRSSSVSRQADGILLRLQIGGKTRLQARRGARPFAAELDSGSVAVFADGFELEEITWHATGGDVLFVRLAACQLWTKKCLIN